MSAPTLRRGAHRRSDDGWSDDSRERARALLPEIPVEHRARRRSSVWLVRLLAGVMTLALVGGVFAAAWGYRWWQQQVGSQETVATAALAPASLAAYREAGQHAATAVSGTGRDPIVLTYHDISPQGSAYVVTPQQFAAQMAMLHASGYHSLTAAEFLQYQQGGDVPARSVLITFDDGTRGLYTYADKVLARYGFHAISFVITGRVGTHRPYYLTWPQISRMAASGRWDFESHTHDLHTQVKLPGGRMASELSARIPVHGKLETLPQFQRRVTSDLQQSIADLRAHGLPRPQLFAWPFSDVTGEPTDAQATAYVASEVQRLFTIAFIDGYQPHPATRSILQSGTVERLEVRRRDTDRSLFQQLQELQTLPVSAMSPTEVDDRWLEPGGYPAPMDTDLLAKGVVTPDANTLNYLAADWAPQRTSEWSSYQVTAMIHPAAGASPGLRVRVNSPGEVAVRVSGNVAEVTLARKQVARVVFGDIGNTRTDHRVTLTVTPRQTVVVLDGRRLAVIPATADQLGGLGVVFSRADPSSPWSRIDDLHVRSAS